MSDIINGLNSELFMHVIHFTPHPIAELIQQRVKEHRVSVDRKLPFYEFHFINVEYDYGYLKAEWERENEIYYMYGDLI